MKIELETFEEYKEKWKNELYKKIEDIIGEYIKNNTKIRYNPFEWRLEIEFKEDKENEEND